DKIIIIKRKNFHKFAFYIKSIFRKYDIIIDYINNPTSTIIAFFTKSKIKIGTKNKRNIFYTHRLEIRERCYNAIKNLKMLRPLGLTDFSDYMPEFFVNKEDKEKAELFLKNTGIAHKKLVGIFASAKYITRKYIPEHFAKLAELIVENSNYRVLFLFGKDDIQTLERIKNSLKIEKDIYFAPLSLSIGELAAFMEKTKFIITTDTGPKHIAVALGIPTLTIFSATNPEDWNPPDLDKFPIIRKEIDCIGCNKLTCDSLRCMKELSPEEIFEVAKRFIS
ncbi:MAG TPA: glycosyltransferase family 9 protein, partial [Candidatus Atribacteria bacterium]|nr:glycosyltransferase family 9 protein [Candidatus Atribacteria bacterium]